jgi:hypothetical protein
MDLKNSQPPERSPPSERESNPVLLPAEAIALTVALAQVMRGEVPPPNTATLCVLALARLTGKYDWTTTEGQFG